MQNTNLNSLSDYDISSSNDSVVHHVHGLGRGDARAHVVSNPGAARQDLGRQELSEWVLAPLDVYDAFCYFFVFYLVVKMIL